MLDRQVLVAYDFSPSSRHALARAVEVALATPEQVVHIVTAIDRAGPALVPPAHDSPEDIERVRERVLADARSALHGRAAVVRFVAHVRTGKAADEILEVAREIGADLIFVGSHGKVGLERLLLGSTSERVVREARCPVLVAREKTYGADVKVA